MAQKKKNAKKKGVLDDTGHHTDTSLAAKTRFLSPIKKGKYPISNQKKIALIEDKFRDILNVLGLDLSDESLKYTPYRVAKMYVEEIFSGLDYKNFPLITTVQDQYHHEQRSSIIFTKVSFSSFCEHHLVPMVGYAIVAYRPRGRLIGLSKIPRIVRYFAKRPQLQERLTAQIADSLSILVGTEDVAVSTKATHFCVLARGVEDERSCTITNVLRGEFDSNPNSRDEFFNAVKELSENT